MKSPYTNNTAGYVTIGDVTIAPGETRMVLADLVMAPPEDGDAIVENVDPLLALLDGNVQSVVDILPTLTSEELATLEAAETGGKTRKGVLDGITLQKLQRASAVI